MDAPSHHHRTLHRRDSARRDQTITLNVGEHLVDKGTLDEGTADDEVPWFLVNSDPFVRGLANSAQKDASLASVFDVKIGCHPI
jgi:hypothetical protein